MKSNEVVVSVIIPVFNIEAYIERCLKSLMVQSYSAFEVIIVDDGSTDNTGNICDRYAHNDNRFHVIHKTQEGVSIARNTALEKAVGELIVFVDGDDWVDTNYIDYYVKKLIQNNSDFVMGEYYSEIDGKTVEKKISNGTEGNLDKGNAYLKILNPRGLYGSVWAKIFKTKIIRDGSILFNPKISIGEDLQFVMRYIDYCMKIYYSYLPLYHYVHRDGSALRSYTLNNNVARIDIIYVYKEILEKAIRDNTNYKKRIAALYTYECADWYCKLENQNNKSYKHFAREAKCFMPDFLSEKSYTIKSKISLLLKLLFPRVAYKFRRK